MNEIFEFMLKNSTELISGFGVLLLAILHKFRKNWKSKLNIDGRWQGMSVYIPLQNDSDHECLYKLRVKITQRGPYLYFKEDIFEILDSKNNIMMRPERTVIGKGKFYSDKDIIIKLQEEKGLTCGVIYMVSDSWGNELSGYIVVTNPFDGRPVVVKILLRRTDDKVVGLSDLNFNDIKFIHDKFLV